MSKLSSSNIFKPAGFFSKVTPIKESITARISKFHPCYYSRSSRQEHLDRLQEHLDRRIPNLKLNGAEDVELGLDNVPEDRISIKYNAHNTSTSNTFYTSSYRAHYVPSSSYSTSRYDRFAYGQNGPTRELSNYGDFSNPRKWKYTYGT